MTIEQTGGIGGFVAAIETSAPLVCTPDTGEAEYQRLAGPYISAGQ